MEGRFNGGFFALRFCGAYSWSGLYIEGLIFGILWYFTIVLLLLLITFEVKSHCWEGGKGQGWRDEGINPKPLKKLSFGAESQVTIT